MKISYNWLKEYLPQDEATIKATDTPHKIGDILTSVGLEVENISKHEEITNSLSGLVIGEVMQCEKHENADKLKITQVNIGEEKLLQIVCGAPNVAVGQKVVVATVGTTIYPIQEAPFTLKKVKIRGVESNGMLCAEDEIGIGKSHEGIINLPTETKAGTPAADYYLPYIDYTIEIGLTPNRMDAMSHLGVAKDVCAYLSHHYKKSIRVNAPGKNNFKADNYSNNIAVEIADPLDCPRYCGVSISGIKVAASPKWLQNKLKSIGLKPINNIVDITNFILQETGQPLHAFDADKIKGGKVIVKTLSPDTGFITLDGTTRKLSGEDIMICDGAQGPMCIAGVYGGAESGVSENSTNLFLESAVFNPISIRKSMIFHNLRTDAAVRFEKGIDIGNTANVLKRAATLIKEIAGGSISSEIIDVYPYPKAKKEVTLSNHYLKKISGKNYHPDTVKNILKSLNFTISRESIDDLQVAVPFSNPDIALPADIIEEIMRIDGLDNIDIPVAIKMAPAIDQNLPMSIQKEKTLSWLVGNGFYEIFTNSITSSNYFNEAALTEAVPIINSLSEGLNVMRPSMLPTGLECIAYNINRKNNDLLFAEFGKTYSKAAEGYDEKENLALYFTGNQNEVGWNAPSKKIDIYYAKGICNALFNLVGLSNFSFEISKNEYLNQSFSVMANGKEIAIAGGVNKSVLGQFSIKQEVFYACIDWQKIIDLTVNRQISFKPISKFPKVQRDLSIVVDKNISFQEVDNLVKSLLLNKLIHVQLFDIFESEKLGNNKKSFAISFTFLDKEKTLTDKEIDAMMTKIIKNIETIPEAEIRRNA